MSSPGSPRGPGTQGSAPDEQASTSAVPEQSSPAALATRRAVSELHTAMVLPPVRSRPGLPGRGGG